MVTVRCPRTIKEGGVGLSLEPRVFHRGCSFRLGFTTPSRTVIVMWFMLGFVAAAMFGSAPKKQVEIKQVEPAPKKVEILSNEELFARLSRKWVLLRAAPPTWWGRRTTSLDLTRLGEAIDHVLDQHLDSR